MPSPDHRAQAVRHSFSVSEGWCGQEDSNFQEVSPTSTSSWRVYQFRHGRIISRSQAIADWLGLDQGQPVAR